MLAHNAFSIAPKAKIRSIVFIFTFIFIAITQTAHATPTQQVDESRSFDAVIVDRGYVFGARGARDCRTNQLIDLSDGNFGRQVQVGRTYHFENAWIFEGNPGQLFFLLSNSRGFRYWEISGCPSVAPPQVNFSVDQNNLMQGQCATLHWDVDNVRAVYLDGQGVSGHDSKYVCPQSTTTYNLRAVTNSGDINRSVTINIRIPPPAIEFTVDRSTIVLGECTTLRWALAYVSSMSLDGASISNPGAKQVCPTSTTTYTLHATSSSGDINKMITINVQIPPASLDFRSDRTRIQRGECVTFNWSAANVQTLALDGASLTSNSGSMQDCPNATKTYNLRATSRSGDLNRSITVNVVEPPPFIDFKAASSRVYRDQCTVLTWLASNAEQTFLNGENLGRNTFFGSREICPSATTTYEFKAVNSSGERTQSVTIAVIEGPAKPTPVPAQNNIFEEGQCTWWAFKKRSESGHPIPIVEGGYGKWDAKNWATNAKEQGLPVDQNPAVGDVVVWPPNTIVPDTDGNPVQISFDAGHVAYVEEVEVHYEIQNGKPVPIGYLLKISESNGGCNRAQDCKRYIWATTDAQFIH